MRPGVLHVLAPGLLDRTRQWVQQYGPLPRYAGLDTILARADCHRSPSHGIDACLCEQFGLFPEAGHDLPLGALRRYGYGGARDTANWACADPVHLRADVSTLYLRDGGLLDITDEEAERLAQAFEAHFAGEGWRLERASPTDWHLRLPASVSVVTHPQRSTLGRPIAGFLPTGQEGAAWRAWLNEIQMLFHGSEVNRQRDARRAPSISGLWLYGTGALPRAASLSPGATTLWSDDPLAIGLARLSGVDIMPRPPCLATILRNPVQGSHLVILDEILRPAAYDDLGRWREAMEVLDAQWFRPAHQAIASGDLVQFHLYDCCGRRFSLERKHRWRIWRRPRSLDMYPPAAGPSAP